MRGCDVTYKNRMLMLHCTPSFGNCVVVQQGGKARPGKDPKLSQGPRANDSKANNGAKKAIFVNALEDVEDDMK
jgi:hypothetical protein